MPRSETRLGCYSQVQPFRQPYGLPAYGPQPQSAYSPLTVVCTCFGCRLRVANAFGVVPTGHALPSVSGGHSFMKRVTRKGRHVRFGQIPFNCPFSGRRAQSPAVIVAGQFTSSWLLYGAPYMPPRKRAQGFDVALYRRGAGRLVGAEVDFAASPTPSSHTPSPKKTKCYHRIACRAAVKANSVGSLVQRELPRRG